MQCPRCKGDSFVSNRYEHVQVDTCNSCHGVWLDEGEIISIIESKEKKFSQELIRDTVSMSFSGVPQSERDEVLNCPKCNAGMIPVNYVVSSGVIIDRCPNDHGLWLDNHELEKVQAFREYWIEEVEKHRGDFIQLISDQEEKIKADKNHKSRKNSALYTLAEIFTKLF